MSMDQDLQKLLAKLTPRQRDAATCSAPHLLIPAPPGSGKTLVSVIRLLYILATNPGAKVQIVTFTKKAAREFYERALAFGAPEDSFVVGTFHNQCLRIWKAQGKTTEGRDIAHDSLQVRYLETARGAIANPMAKGEATATINRYFASPYSHFCSREKELIEKFFSLLGESNLSTHFETIKRVVDGFREGNIRVPPFQHVIVDEGQDIDDLQLEYLKHFIREGIHTTVVGDDDQSIYGFKYCLGVKGLIDYRTIAGDSMEIVLDTNFRSHSEIVDVALRLIGHSKTRIHKDLISSRGSGGAVEAFELANEVEETTQVCLYLKELLTKGTLNHLLQTPSSIPLLAILARTNKILDRYECGLAQRGIPYFRDRKESIFDHWINLFVKGFIESLISENSVIEIHKAFNAHPDFMAIFKERAKQDEPLSEDISAYISWISDRFSKLCTGDAAARSHGIAASFQSFPVLYEQLRKSPSQVSGNDIKAIFHWAVPFVPESQKNILEAICKIYARRKGGYENRLRANVMIQKKPSHDVVVLDTIHGSKGLEYHWVVMVCCHQPQLNDVEYDLEEERRIQYVGMTRARDHLILTGNRKKGISTFLREAGLEVIKKTTLTLGETRKRKKIRR